jgi:hypothetical protein
MSHGQGQRKALPIDSFTYTNEWHDERQGFPIRWGVVGNSYLMSLPLLVPVPGHAQAGGTGGSETQPASSQNFIAVRTAPTVSSG